MDSSISTNRRSAKLRAGGCESEDTGQPKRTRRKRRVCPPVKAVLPEPIATFNF